MQVQDVQEPMRLCRSSESRIWLQTRVSDIMSRWAGVVVVRGGCSGNRG